MNIELNDDEVIEDLQFKNLKIIQNKKGFCCCQTYTPRPPASYPACGRRFFHCRFWPR